MGLLKNSRFLDLLEEQEERDRMELAGREQEFLNSRGVPASEQAVGLSAANPPAITPSGFSAPIPNANTNRRKASH